MRERVLHQIQRLRERHEEEIRRLIGKAARLGVRSEDIARALGIGRSTLWRRYKNDLSSYHDGEERSERPRAAA